MKSRDPIRLAGIIVAVAFSLALSACSAIKLGYNTLPELAYFWLDGYADFNDQQEPLVRTEIARIHAWHRREELPRMTQLLAQMETLAPQEITPQQACNIVAEVQARLQVAADLLGPAVGTVAVTFTEPQLRHMERKFRRANDKFRKEWVTASPAQAQEKRYEDSLQRLEMIYGRLDEPQREVLRQGLAQSSYDPARILADRQRRQQDLLQTLRQVNRSHAAPEEARAQLRAWLDRASHAPDPAYRAWQEGLVQEGCRIFSAVHHSTTATQREQAVRRLRAYQRDLRDLSGQAQPQ
jgi:hypothetical protein